MYYNIVTKQFLSCRPLTIFVFSAYFESRDGNTERLLVIGGNFTARDFECQRREFKINNRNKLFLVYLYFEFVSSFANVSTVD